MMTTQEYIAYEQQNRPQNAVIAAVASSQAPPTNHQSEEVVILPHDQPMTYCNYCRTCDDCDDEQIDAFITAVKKYGCICATSAVSLCIGAVGLFGLQRLALYLFNL